MTRAKMLAERKCGLKYWDKAEALVGRKTIIEKAIEFHKQTPWMWGNKAGTDWNNFTWALGGAVREIACPDSEPPMSWNVNDVLTDEEITHVQTQCGYIGNYIPTWPRE